MALDLLLHPDQRKRISIIRRRLPAGLVALTLLLVGSYLRFHEIGFDVLLVVLLAALGSADYLLIRCNAALYVRGTTFGVRSPLRRKSELDVSTLTGVERVNVQRGNQPPTPQYLMLGINGSVQTRIRDDLWSDEDLQRLWQRLDLLPTGSFDRVLTYRAYKQAYADR